MKKRESNFEVLRIIAMYMVMILHYLNYYIDSFYFLSKLNWIVVTEIVLNAFCIVAVNVYVLMSGFFLSQKPFSFHRLLRLLFQVLFYTVSIPIFLVVIGLLPFSEFFNIYHIWNSIFPIQSGQYWFVSAYVIMILFSPYMNMAFEKLEKKQLEFILSLLLIFFCLGKSISPIQYATDRYGYDFGWFMVLYLCGGYIHKFGIPFLKSKSTGFFIYLISVCTNICIELTTIKLSNKYAGFDYYVNVPFHYNFILCFVGAIGLFYGFMYIRIQKEWAEKIVFFISESVLSVYLIHEQMDIAPHWCEWIDHLTALFGISIDNIIKYHVLFIPIMFVQITLTFLTCILIDKIRLHVEKKIMEVKRR